MPTYKNFLNHNWLGRSHRLNFKKQLSQKNKKTKKKLRSHYIKKNYIFFVIIIFQVIVPSNKLKMFNIYLIIQCIAGVNDNSTSYLIIMEHISIHSIRKNENI